MQIKLSRQQWEEVGKQKGWMKVADYGITVPYYGITVPCKYCGKKTDMTATKLCNDCWEMHSRMESRPDIAKKILLDIESKRGAKDAGIAQELPDLKPIG